MEIKIRELKRKDRRIVAAMIRKMVEKIGSTSLLNMIVTDTTATKNQSPAQPEKHDQFTHIGIEVVKMMIEVLEDDVAKWFADLLGCTVEELDEMPVDVEVDIIRQLMDAPESNRFFTGAWDLSRRTKELAGKLSKANSK